MTSDAVAAELAAADVLVAASVPTRERQARGHPGRAHGGHGDRPAGRGQPPVGHPRGGDTTASTGCSCRPATTRPSPTRSSASPATRPAGAPRDGRSRDGARAPSTSTRTPGPWPTRIARAPGRHRRRRDARAGRAAARRRRRSRPSDDAPAVLAGGRRSSGYTYVGFPLLVMLRARLRPRPQRDRRHHADASASSSPPTTRPAAIGARVDNLLALDYPAGPLEIVIASDGSTDGDRRRGRRRDRSARRGSSTCRALGKAAALNAAVAASTGEILVFSDANTAYAPDAVRQLVRSFADPEVGGRGRQPGLPAGSRLEAGRPTRPARRPSAPASGATGTSTGWSRRPRASAAASSPRPGRSTPCAASCSAPVPDGVTDDFVTSTRVVAPGRRLVFEPAAIALEPVAGSERPRVPAQGPDHDPRPARRGRRARDCSTRAGHGFYAVQLLTHKLLRRLMVVPLLVIAVASPALWDDGPIYRLATVGQVAVYGLGALGLALRRAAGRAAAVVLDPGVLLLVNVASLHALCEPRQRPAHRSLATGPTCGAPADASARARSGSVAA